MFQRTSPTEGKKILGPKVFVKFTELDLTALWMPNPTVFFRESRASPGLVVTNSHYQIQRCEPKANIVCILSCLSLRVQVNFPA